MQVPFLDLRTQFQRLREELLPEMTAVMEKAAFIGGPALRDFEAAFAAFCGAEHAVGVASGTDALQLALRAAQVAPGAEVITAANTFVATVEAIALAGCKPVLVDMDPETYHLDIGKIEDAITPRTRVIMPVHLYGDAVDMDPILEIARRRELLVIEDAAQAHGATCRGRSCGAMGDLAGFSFYPGKNLGAYGDGGAVTTGNEEYATRLRQLGDHGSPKKYHHDFLGTNSRLDTLQAVVLATKLRHLPEWNASRRAVARAYEERLGDIEGLRLPRIREGFDPVFHLYVIRSARVKEIDAALQAAGVGFGYHYPVPVHLQPAFRELGEPGRFPEAEKGAQEILSLPMFAEMSEDQIDYVTGTLRAVFER
jgi:dTDP-4-amino-4,6-dideoxygalactose transaminase